MTDTRWYFNTSTGRPEQGPLSPASHRMGPYRSREEAMDAWKIVRERNLVWDAQDRQWHGDEAPGSDASTGSGQDPSVGRANP
ncbi:hypothetical protein [uncultured Bifidobacterium sp.]|uniref:hypothetical protein n=1 Tax=uncultured Bifidobacterium sp. TaxID=165187 RepID=UPI0028DB156A|nr:hypothetical protein [uncultured Bifidobacterium sp.]